MYIDIWTAVLITMLGVLTGHIVGYLARKREEKPGQVTLVVNKDYIDFFQPKVDVLLAVKYKGELVEKVDINGIDVEKQINITKKVQNKEDEN